MLDNPFRGHHPRLAQEAVASAADRAELTLVDAVGHRIQRIDRVRCPLSCSTIIDRRRKRLEQCENRGQLIELNVAVPVSPHRTWCVCDIERIDDLAKRLKTLGVDDRIAEVE